MGPGEWPATRSLPPLAAPTKPWRRRLPPSSSRPLITVAPSQWGLVLARVFVAAAAAGQLGAKRALKKPAAAAAALRKAQEAPGRKEPDGDGRGAPPRRLEHLARAAELQASGTLSRRRHSLARSLIVGLPLPPPPPPLLPPLAASTHN